MDFIRYPAAPAAAQKVSKRAWLGLQLPVLVLRAEPFCPYLFWVLSHPLPGKYYLCTTLIREIDPATKRSTIVDRFVEQQNLSTNL